MHHRTPAFPSRSSDTVLLPLVGIHRLHTERMVICVGARKPVPPGEVQGLVDTGVQMVDEVCARSCSAWRQAPHHP